MVFDGGEGVGKGVVKSFALLGLGFDGLLERDYCLDSEKDDV